MYFKRSVQRYGRTPLPATPYQRAGQLWDERIGSARVQACGSACKRDPVSGVIGVEKGPLIPVL
jgi:hypothetical protein